MEGKKFGCNGCKLCNLALSHLFKLKSDSLMAGNKKGQQQLNAALAQAKPKLTISAGTTINFYFPGEVVSCESYRKNILVRKVSLFASSSLFL